MTSLKHIAQKRNHISLPIEQFSPQIPHPSTAAGSYLAAHYLVPAGIADLVARLAGLGTEKVRA